MISDADHEAVWQARDQAVAMIEQGEGPFAGWRTWRSESAWGTPTLPSNVLTADLPDLSSACDYRRRGFGECFGIRLEP